MVNRVYKIYSYKITNIKKMTKSKMSQIRAKKTTFNPYHHYEDDGA
jgi:hypothetical protein